MRSTRIRTRTRERGFTLTEMMVGVVIIGIIVGAQVGETSILTRAALTVMNANRANLVAAEGAFGTHLLQRDLTSPSLMFGKGGTLDADQVADSNGPGLGLQIHEQDLVAAEQPHST